ncbi:MAG: 5'/3'-nucleotidase SurE [Chloroflexi bacterium]|nr:MAG: 5'/3'-nucleotidase SurE [Chloroflexota bacterium]
MTITALVTNDDGIASEGLRRLALVALTAGLRTVVAAPREEASGSSAALTAQQADGRIVVERRDLEGVDGADVYAVAGTPGFIALIASRGAFGAAPHVVLSGINRGANTGNAILHSGTVGATLTARTHDCKALAISLAGADPVNWATAERVAREALALLLGIERPVVLNVNVPDVSPEQLRGMRRATLSAFGAVQTTITEIGHGYVKIGVSDSNAEHEPGTDAALLAAGFATITPLEPICEQHAVALPGLDAHAIGV